MFLSLIVVGLVGLLAMAIPAFGQARAHVAHHGGTVGHGAVARGTLARGHGAGRLARVDVARSSVRGASDKIIPADVQQASLLRFLPSPRAVCSVLALYGAFGNALVHAAHLHGAIAAIAAVFPALLFERFAVRPVWNLVFRFQGEPSSPLEQLVMSDARAVVPFRNGRGLVSTVRDGRQVQFAARLRDDQRSLRVGVGDRLIVEDVDAKHESVTVSVPGND